MIAHNGKTWRTLADKIYHGDRQISAVYKGGVKYYPDESEPAALSPGRLPSTLPTTQTTSPYNEEGKIWR